MDLSDKLKKGVVQIRTKSGSVTGAGFLVSGNQVVTCAHVVNLALSREGHVPQVPLDEEVRLEFPFVDPKTVLSACVLPQLWVPPQVEGKYLVPCGGDMAVLKLASDPPPDAQPIELTTRDNLKDVWDHPLVRTDNASLMFDRQRIA